MKEIATMMVVGLEDDRILIETYLKGIQRDEMNIIESI